ncbi:MAG: hypothetical protein GX833_11085 [Clostridium sp.]|nr:hypothetical protein [Clostridium sp.]
MKKIGKKKSIIIAIACLLVLWIAMGLADYIKVSNFERPIFCLLDVENSYEDGGSGTYNGLGYSFDIKGNFMPEDEYPGVTRYTYYVFGSEVSAGIRD